MLAGSLDAFGLPDVFQLLALTKKSGTLRIRSARSEGRVEFLQGEIAYAVSDTRRMALASRLLGGGMVNDAQLRHLVVAQRGGAATLTSALLEEGVLDDATFDRFVGEQIQDAVFELMRLREGSFDFEASERQEPGDDGGHGIRLTVSPEELVTEGQRRLREWSEIQEHVVSFDAVVTLAPQPPAESSTVSMDAEQWRLLTLLDGRRTVRDLVDLTGRGEYATCQVVAGLVGTGLVEVVDPTAGGRTGLSELVARHELLHRLEERELGASNDGRSRPVPAAPPEQPRHVVEEPVAVQPEDTPQEQRPEAEDNAFPEPQRAERPPVRDEPLPVPVQRTEEAAPLLDDDDEFGPVVGYQEDIEDSDAFDREEVERELAALGFREGGQQDDPDAEDADQNPFRINRADDVNRGLLSRLIDVRKHP